MAGEIELSTGNAPVWVRLFPWIFNREGKTHMWFLLHHGRLSFFQKHTRSYEALYPLQKLLSIEVLSVMQISFLFFCNPPLYLPTYPTSKPSLLWSPRLPHPVSAHKRSLHLILPSLPPTLPQHNFVPVDYTTDAIQPVRVFPEALPFSPLCHFHSIWLLPLSSLPRLIGPAEPNLGEPIGRLQRTGAACTSVSPSVYNAAPFGIWPEEFCKCWG